jgi:hypothetical protein
MAQILGLLGFVAVVAVIVFAIWKTKGKKPVGAKTSLGYEDKK